MCTRTVLTCVRRQIKMEEVERGGEKNQLLDQGLSCARFAKVASSFGPGNALLQRKRANKPPNVSVSNKMCTIVTPHPFRDWTLLFSCRVDSDKSIRDPFLPLFVPNNL